MIGRARIVGVLAGLTVGVAGAIACSTGDSGPRLVTKDAGIPEAASDVATCGLPPAPATSPYALRYDQLGYLPGGEVWAVVLGSGQGAPSYRVFDADSKCLVGVGTAGPRGLDATSLAGTQLTGDRLSLAMITKPGRYLVVLDDGARFGPLVVGGDAYAEVMPKLLEFLHAQRCGKTDLATSKHASCHLFGSIGDPTKHSGDGIVVDDGYTGPVNADAGPPLDVEGGWHDAGDYIKFVGTTSFTLAVDLLALRDHGPAFDLAGAGSSRVALRAEMRWGLDWLVKMLGGVELHHQVSGSLDHDVGWRIPEGDTTTPLVDPANPLRTYDHRPVFRFGAGKGANLLARSAAACALGADVFADDAPYAAMLGALAEQLYATALTVPIVQNPDPKDYYPEDSFHDDLSFAAGVLAQRSPSNPQYAYDALKFARMITTAPGGTLFWGGVDALAYLETALAYPDGSQERNEMAQRLAVLASPILASKDHPFGGGAAFGYALPTFGNGSLEEALGAAATCLAAHRLGGSDGCVEVARTQLHWLFGQNPFGVSFMVGTGTLYPLHIQHALSLAAKVQLTGAIVGGPTSLQVVKDSHATDPGLPLPDSAGPFAPFSTNELLYEDIDAEYVTNEPAIDFTAPLVFTLGELLAQ